MKACSQDSSTCCLSCHRAPLEGAVLCSPWLSNLPGRLQANEKLSLKAAATGDVLKQLIPLIDFFEAAKNSVKTENEGEERVAGAYLVSLNCLLTGTTAAHV